MTERRCGSCTLCCKLIPVRELHKKAGVRCQHQRLTGCRIYANRPVSCALWSCGWLVGDDTADLPRPDRAHYVIDEVPDFVTINGDEWDCVQIWCDPAHRDAWRSPEMLAYIERRAAEGVLTLVRYGSHEAVTVFAPGVNADRQWHEVAAPINWDLSPLERWQNAG